MLLLGIATAHVYILASEQALPAYFVVYAVVMIAGCLSVAGSIGFGRDPRVAQAGWYFGDLLSVVFLGVAVGTRIVNLPSLAALTGRWDFDPSRLRLRSRQRSSQCTGRYWWASMWPIRSGNSGTTEWIHGTSGPRKGGKRRIHQKPGRTEVVAFSPGWSPRSRRCNQRCSCASVRPPRNRCCGIALRVSAHRGEATRLPTEMDWQLPAEPVGWATVHPSAVLRDRSDNRDEVYTKSFVEDLRSADGQRR